MIHPDASGSVLITESTDACGYGCKVTDWDGTWFAIHDPATGMGMIVNHVASPFSVALWIDNDSGSFTNASSVLLLPPPGGFTGSVTETEYLYFYDSSTWTPSLILPFALSPGNLNMQDSDPQVFMPVLLR
ncbi:MAG: hypothetical protein H6Q38_3215 [Chloroflexi bacterium]|nr:hypothetical protein [Chloroflexota bacterium]